jgi:hypothetical protein
VLQGGLGKSDCISPTSRIPVATVVPRRGIPVATEILVHVTPSVATTT